MSKLSLTDINYSILDKIIDHRFNFHDLDPKRFPVLIDNDAYYCMFHENSHTGTKQARLYQDEENHNLWVIYCYAEGKRFYAHDYVQKVLISDRELYRNTYEFLLDRLGTKEFEMLYKLFLNQRHVDYVSEIERKEMYINNTYLSTGNTVDFIEALYTEVVPVIASEDDDEEFEYAGEEYALLN